MSTPKKLRKRTKIDYSKSRQTPRKKIKIEDTEESEERDLTISKQPIIAPNGNIFYPCQHCSKIFPQKVTSITHMKKCSKKIDTTAVLHENKLSINNNLNKTIAYIDEELNDSGSSTENQSPKARNNVNQNITSNDVSVYDYNEQDEKLEDRDLKENSEESSNNRQCKHCKTLFDNPLDLLRHTRDCHNFPRTILPPDEIEKYFDYPNRQFCPICEKPIKTRNFRSVFIKHLLVHTTGLTHECGICKKKFRRRDHMRAHEKRHIVSV